MVLPSPAMPMRNIRMVVVTISPRSRSGGGSLRCIQVVADSAERSQETLGLLSGFETLEHPLAFARRQVRILRPIVQTLVTPMLRGWEHAFDGRPIACELVGDYYARLDAALAVERAI